MGIIPSMPIGDDTSQKKIEIAEKWYFSQL